MASMLSIAAIPDAAIRRSIARTDRPLFECCIAPTGRQAGGLASPTVSFPPLLSGRGA